MSDQETHIVGIAGYLKDHWPFIATVFGGIGAMAIWLKKVTIDQVYAPRSLMYDQIHSSRRSINEKIEKLDKKTDIKFDELHKKINVNQTDLLKALNEHVERHHTT